MNIFLKDKDKVLNSNKELTYSFCNAIIEYINVNKLGF